MQKLISSAALLGLIGGAVLSASDCNDLNTSNILSFNQVVSGMSVVRDFEFGTDSDRNIHNTTDLASYFCVYGIAGTTVVNGEWGIYPGGPSSSCGTFNTTNWTFANRSMQLVATVNGNYNGSTLKAGDLNTGQITTQDTYLPGVSTSGGNYKAYAFEIDMQFPNIPGAWPAFWLYTRDPMAIPRDASEIDMLEFEIGLNGQTSQDAAFATHGPGVGTPTYDLLNTFSIYNNGTNWATTHHKYQCYWTTDYRYTYLDGALLQAIPFTWTSHGGAAIAAPQVIANLAIGPFGSHLASNYPASMDITHITVWGR